MSEFDDIDMKIANTKLGTTKAELRNTQLIPILAKLDVVEKRTGKYEN